MDPRASSHTCTHCTLDAIGSDVVVADFGEDGDDPAPPVLLFEGEEVIASSGLKDATGLGCTELASPEFNIGSSGGPGVGAETDFGARMAVGGGSDDDSIHLALTAPRPSSVFVFANFEPGNTPQSIQPPEGSVGFGSDPIAFLDIDTNDGDELVVGDPLASAEGVLNAGQVGVFEFSDDDGFSPRGVIHDSSPEVGQNDGRAITETEFVVVDDTDMLVVGAVDEVFALFRSLSNGVDARRK